MKKKINIILIIISITTIISGMTQVVRPDFVLHTIGAEVTPTSSHFFAIIGMFMFLFGGLMLHTVYSEVPSRASVLWCSLQKLGAAIAVGIGILNEIFSLIATGVALFDLFSGIVFLYYFYLLKSDAIH